MPPGGDASTHVAQMLGFLREGQYPSGRTNRAPIPANGAPQIPQRGLDGRALRIPLRALSNAESRFLK
jgi:hypothetical protein